MLKKKRGRTLQTKNDNNQIADEFIKQYIPKRIKAVFRNVN